MAVANSTGLFHVVSQMVTCIHPYECCVLLRAPACVRVCVCVCDSDGRKSSLVKWTRFNVGVHVPFTVFEGANLPTYLGT